MPARNYYRSTIRHTEKQRQAMSTAHHKAEMTLTDFTRNAIAEYCAKYGVHYPDDMPKQGEQSE